MSDPGKILRDEIQKAFPEFGSIRKMVTYISTGESVYDPTDGTVNESEETQFSLYVIFGSIRSFDEFKVEDEVPLPNDKSILFPQLDSPVQPKINDKLIEGSVAWRVKGIKADPADATYLLWVRPL